MSKEDETIPVSSGKKTRPNMSLATNNADRRYTADSKFPTERESFGNESRSENPKSDKPKEKK